MTINERLFKTIDEKNIKQIELANYLNIKQSVIASWKTRGTNPPSELLIRICEFLDITVFELLGEKQEYTTEEQKLIEAYNKATPGIKQAVNKLLEIEEEKHTEKSSTSKIG